MTAKGGLWYAVRVRAGFEMIVTANLTKKGYEVFLPSSKSRRHNKKEPESRLFPGYVFCRMQAAGKRSVFNTPGVLYIAGNGSERGFRVDEVELAAVKKVDQSQLLRQSVPLSKGGPKVRVMDGPLRNLEGTCVDSGNPVRLAIPVSVIQRSVLVELARGTGVATLGLPESMQVSA